MKISTRNAKILSVLGFIKIFPLIVIASLGIMNIWPPIVLGVDIILLFFYIDHAEGKKSNLQHIRCYWIASIMFNEIKMIAFVYYGSDFLFDIVHLIFHEYGLHRREAIWGLIWLTTLFINICLSLNSLNSLNAEHNIE